MSSFCAEAACKDLQILSGSSVDTIWPPFPQNNTSTLKYSLSHTVTSERHGQDRYLTYNNRLFCVSCPPSYGRRTALVYQKIIRRFLPGGNGIFQLVTVLGKQLLEYSALVRGISSVSLKWSYLCSA